MTSIDLIRDHVVYNRNYGEDYGVCTREFDFFIVDTRIYDLFIVTTRNYVAFFRNYGSQCDHSYAVTASQSCRSGTHGYPF